jgi:aminoglycoside phosphotransferase (APT) family kinase protein
VTSFDAFWADTLALREQTDEALRTRLTGDEYATVQAWWDDFIDDDALQQGPRCLVHGDLWWDNLLVDQGGENLLGVIDFGDAATIDPSYDFVPLLESGRSLLDACIRAYEAQVGCSGGGNSVPAVSSVFERRSTRGMKRRRKTRSPSYGGARSCAPPDSKSGKM